MRYKKYLINTMNKDTFDFGEALAYIKVGETVQITINGVCRRYYLKDNVIVCIPNGKSHLEYKVKNFHIESVMSDDWELVY